MSSGLSCLSAFDIRVISASHCLHGAWLDDTSVPQTARVGVLVKRSTGSGQRRFPTTVTHYIVGPGHPDTGQACTGPTTSDSPATSKLLEAVSP